MLDMLPSAAPELDAASALTDMAVVPKGLNRDYLFRCHGAERWVYEADGGG